MSEKYIEFSGRTMLELVADELPGSYVEQTGGGTATLMFFKGTGVPGQLRAGEAAIAAGPGSYNWDKPDESVFRSGEFAFGREDYDSNGNEWPDDAPSERMDPENPDLGAVAERIIAKYREYNPEVVAGEPDGSVASAMPGNPFAAAVDTCNTLLERLGTDATAETLQMAQNINATMALAFELRTKNMIAIKGYTDIEQIAQRMGYSVNNPV